MKRTPRSVWLAAISTALLVPALIVSGSTIAAASPGPHVAAPTDLAAPNTAKLAGALSKQKLTWQTCDFGDPDLNKRFATVPNVKCASVTVPRDWHDAGNGKTWTIRISQAFDIATTNPRYKGTLFVNPGGPGGPGLPWAAAMQDRTSDLRPYYNYIGFDPRGVGQSSQVTCAYEFDAASTDPLAEVKAQGAACSTDPDVRTINTEQTTYDMDFIRGLLKAPKLDYVGYSYGTWLGAWYEKVFTANTGRVLLDSSTNVTLPTLQKTWDLQPNARDRQFKLHMMNWIARHDAEYGLGTDPQAIYQRYFAATKNLGLTTALVWVLGGGAAAFPSNDQYPVAASTVQTLIEVGERENAAGDDPATTAQKALQQLVSVRSTGNAQRNTARAGAAKLRSLAEVEVPTSPAMQKSALNSAFDFIRCNDGQWTQGQNYWQNWAKKAAPKAPLSDSFGSFSVPLCAFWKTNNLMPVADAATFPKTVVIQGELDSQTAYETGYATGTKLPNTTLTLIDNEGSHGHFPYGTECVDRPIYNYFLTGKLPKKDIAVCQALPLVQDEMTYESWGRLDAKGKETPAPGSPWIPAATPKKTAEGLALTPDANSADLIRSLVTAVQARYGPEGVKVLGLDKG